MSICDPRDIDIMADMTNNTYTLNMGPIGATGPYTNIPSTGGGFRGGNTTWNTTYTTGSWSPPPIDATQVTYNGIPLAAMMDKVCDRLAILEDPTPERLANYAALQEAYKAYKLLDQLIGPDKSVK